MPRKIVMVLLVASVVLPVTAMLAPHLDVALPWLSKVPTVPRAEQRPNNANALSALHSPPSDRTRTAADSPKFDVVRIDPEGASVFAGRAPPNAQVSVLANGEMVATTKADENGQWAIVVEHLFAPGEYQFSLRTRPNGSATATTGGSVRITIAAILLYSLVFFDQSIANRNHAMGTGGDVVFVSNHDDGVAFVVKLFEEVHNFVARGRVQRAGRFIGEKN